MEILHSDDQGLRELIKYPSVVDFRIIVESEISDALDQVYAAIGKIEPAGALKIKDAPRRSRTGRYLSYTLPVKVRSYDNLKQIYAEVGSLSCVKHIL